MEITRTPRNRLPLAMLLLFVAPMAACSSAPIFGGSSLATVDWVKEADQIALAEEVPARVDLALVDDRKRIAQLQERVLTQETELEQANEQLGVLSQTLDEMSAEMQKQAETFHALAVSLQQTTAALDATLTALPTDTLRLFNTALQQYLTAIDESEFMESEFIESDEPVLVPELSPEEGVTEGG